MMVDTDTHKISECFDFAEHARDAMEQAVYLAMANEFVQKASLAGALPAKPRPQNACPITEGAARDLGSFVLRSLEGRAVSQRSETVR